MVDLVLGDDHTIFVEALVAALPERGFHVVETADSLTSTVRSVRRHEPEVCLLDRYFADGDGLDVLGELLRGSPGTRVVVLTADGDAHGMRRAFNDGASGYVNKMCGLGALVRAIEGVVAGEIVAELAAERAPRLAGTTDALRLAAHLTNRERECLELLVEGAQTTTMAKGMGVSTTTVRTHVQSILTKLGVHSRLEAASFALRHSLIDRAERTRLRSRA
ncbi:response regulator [Parasphingorhabdus pacifica]